MNGDLILGGLFGLYAFAEMVTRLTPTQKDDAFLERIGKGAKKFMDVLGIPNRRATPAQTIQASKTEEKKEEKQAG